MIFDTDVLIWFFRGNARAAREIERAAERMVSVVSVMELYQGARSRTELRAQGDFFHRHDFRILALSEGIGHAAVGLIEEHALPDGLHLAGALIAATSREFRAALMTGNVRHFRRIARLQLREFRPGS